MALVSVKVRVSFGIGNPRSEFEQPPRRENTTLGGYECHDASTDLKVSKSVELDILVTAVCVLHWCCNVVLLCLGSCVIVAR